MSTSSSLESSANFRSERDSCAEPFTQTETAGRGEVTSESAEAGEPLFDHFGVSVDRQSLQTTALLKLGWRVDENEVGEKTLTSFRTTESEYALTSISSVSRTFTKRLSVAGYERDDLVQEAFLSLLGSLPSFQGRASLNTYSDRVVRNGLLNRVRDSKRDVRSANSETTSLFLDGDQEEGSEVGDHEVALLIAAQPGWQPEMVEEDRLDDLADHALLDLVDRIPDGVAAWCRIVEREPWQVVAAKMEVSVATAKLRIPPAWVRILAIPEITAIMTTARQRRMVRRNALPDL